MSYTERKRLRRSGRILRKPCGGARQSFRRAFLIERDAKNEAYAFILHTNQYERFRRYHNRVRKKDPYKDCLEYLVSNL